MDTIYLCLKDKIKCKYLVNDIMHYYINDLKAVYKYIYDLDKKTDCEELMNLPNWCWKNKSAELLESLCYPDRIRHATLSYPANALMAKTSAFEYYLDFFCDGLLLFKYMHIYISNRQEFYKKSIEYKLKHNQITKVRETIDDIEKERKELHHFLKGFKMFVYDYIDKQTLKNLESNFQGCYIKFFLGKNPCNFNNILMKLIKLKPTAIQHFNFPN